jgi:hypothetical protein
MEGGHVIHRQFVTGQRGLHAFPRVVHVGHGFQRQDFDAAHLPFRHQAAETLPPWTETVALGDAVNGHEADIVAVACHARFGVAEADPKEHQKRPVLF